MTKPPIVSYVDPSGTAAPSRSRTSSGRHSPGTVQEPSVNSPAGGARPGRARRTTSPTISSTTSSRVTTPDVPPYSSTTTASWRPSSRSMSSSGSSRIVSGTRARSDIRADDRHVVAPLVRHRHRLLDVDDAVDVVPVLADDREAGVAGAPRQPEHVLGRGGALDRRAAHPRGSSRRRPCARRSRASASPAARCPRRACRPRPSAGPATRAPGACARRTAPPAG